LTAVVIAAVVGLVARLVFDSQNKRLYLDQIGEVHLDGGKKESLRLMAGIDAGQFGDTELSQLKALVESDEPEVRSAAYDTVAHMARKDDSTY
jgi:hypothetical protein